MIGQQAGWKTPINHEEQLDLWWETSINLVKICENTVIPKFDLCPNHIKYPSWLGPLMSDESRIKYPLEIIVSMRCERQNTSISMGTSVFFSTNRVTPRIRQFGSYSPQGMKPKLPATVFLRSWRGPNRSGRWWKFTEDIGYSIQKLLSMDLQWERRMLPVGNTKHGSCFPIPKGKWTNGTNENGSTTLVLTTLGKMTNKTWDTVNWGTTKIEKGISRYPLGWLIIKNPSTTLTSSEIWPKMN